MFSVSLDKVKDSTRAIYEETSKHEDLNNFSVSYVQYHDVFGTLYYIIKAI